MVIEITIVAMVILCILIFGVGFWIGNVTADRWESNLLKKELEARKSQLLDAQHEANKTEKLFILISKIVRQYGKPWSGSSERMVLNVEGLTELPPSSYTYVNVQGTCYRLKDEVSLAHPLTVQLIANKGEK